MASISKPILSDMSIANPAFLYFPLAWNIFSYPLTFNLYVSFALRWVSCRQDIIGSCFFIQSATLCLLIGAFSPLTFKVTPDNHVFIAILNLVFQLILFLLCSFLFLVGWFPFNLCSCTFLFSFCGCNVWFWFVVSVFFKYVKPFVYLVGLSYSHIGWNTLFKKKKKECIFSYFPSTHSMILKSFFYIFMFVLWFFLLFIITFTVGPPPCPHF